MKKITTKITFYFSQYSQSNPYEAIDSTKHFNQEKKKKKREEYR